MSSKLFQRRQALKNSPRTASGEGFLSDREENVEEVDTSDVRLAAKKRAEGEVPATKMNPFKNFPGSALIAIQEAITKLEEYATDKNLQNAVVQIGEEIASRPLAAPAAQPVTAGKKKADSVSIDISGGNVHLDVSDGSDSMAAPVPMATPLEPIGEIAPLDVPGDILDETPVEDVTEETVFEGPEDIDFPKEDWEAEVENEQTKLSYQSWVAKNASKQ
jgi:hypothetical protein